VLGQGDQHQGGGTGVAGVAGDDRDVRRQVQRVPHLLGVVVERVVEHVDRHDERGLAPLEEVERVEAVLQAACVRHDHRPERAVRELVPHEPEPVLAGRAEQVQDVRRIERHPAEVERHGRGRLRPHTRQVVRADRGGGDRLLGAQRLDLRDRTDERGLPDPEPARDEEFDGSGDGL
jgi:hypothetical protein